MLAGAADEEQPLDSVDEEDLFSAVQREETKAQHVSGSFFHVDGVGLVDENVVRSCPWMLKTTQPPPFLSTLPQNGQGAGVVLSTAPVPPTQPTPPAQAQPPQNWALPAPTGPAVLDGLTDAPHFNGLTVMIESFDAETNRYTVQLPFLDRASHISSSQTH